MKHQFIGVVTFPSTTATAQAAQGNFDLKFEVNGKLIDATFGSHGVRK